VVDGAHPLPVPPPSRAPPAPHPPPVCRTPDEFWSLTAWVAAVESVVGTVIEGIFVAMLVQRFFGGR
jgi:hypothetical protein